MTGREPPVGGPDIEGMRRFLARRDRDRPDVFAGRTAVIEDLSEAVRLAAVTGGPPGATRVVQGAPGAGKTALLKEILERIPLSAGTAGTDTPLVLEIDPDTFASRTSVVAAVEAAMARREGAEGVEGMVPTAHASETRQRTAGVSAVGVRGTAGRTLTRNYAGQNVAFRTLCERHPDWRAPIVLVVDEAQSIVADSEVPVPGGEPRKQNLTVAELHRGNHGLPIVPVFFGLSRTGAHLSALAASRMAHETTHELGALSRDECLAVARGTLQRYRPRGGAAALEQWALACADASDGWPQHLNNNLCACFEALVGADGTMRTEGLAAARRRAAALRQDYYDKRIEAIGRYSYAARAAMAGLTGEPPWEERVIVDALFEALDGDRRVAPDRVHEATRALFERALDADVLSGAGFPVGQYAPPIPSFAMYLATGEVPERPPPRPVTEGPHPGRGNRPGRAA